MVKHNVDDESRTQEVEKTVRTGPPRGLPANLVKRIDRILDDLAAAIGPRDLDRSAYRLHPLKGDRRGQWSIRMFGNGRIVFRFVDGKAVDVDLTDYHWEDR